MFDLFAHRPVNQFEADKDSYQTIFC